MKKRLVSLLLTVIMVVSLVPFSVMPTLAAGGTVYEITGTGSHPLWGKLTPGSNYPAGNTPAAAGDTVKLMVDVTTTDPQWDVKGAGVTLDLNGHKASAAQSGLAVIATGLGARVVDKAPGNYTLYKTITTTGKQYIAMGLTNYEITGFDTVTSFNRAGTTDNKRSGFLGGYWTGSDSKLYQWELMGVQANNGAKMNNRFCYGTTNVDDSNMNPAITVGTPFTASVRLTDNLQQLIFDGSTKRNTTTAVVCPAPAMPEKSVYLFTHSAMSDNYGSLITALSTDATKGCWGWDGTTEYAKIYGDLTKSGSAANLLREFVPAKAPDGKIGMFDKVEGVFYPLLGNTQSASVSGKTHVAIIDKDGKLSSIKPLIMSVETLNAAVESAKSGDTIQLAGNIDASACDILLSSGVKLDLCGCELKVNTFTAQSTDALLDSSASNTGSLITVASNGFSCPGGDYTYKKNGNTYTIEESMAHKLSTPNKLCILSENYTDTTNKDYVLAQGVTLDLNGYKFTANSLDARNGKVIDSSLDIQNSTEGKTNQSNGQVVVANGKKFLYAESNPFAVIDNEDNTYNLRKYEITYLPGSATGWTLGGVFNSASSKYIQYVTRGEESINLIDMIYTADGAHVSWKAEDGSVYEAGSAYTTPITKNIAFTTTMKLVSVGSKDYISWADAVEEIKDNTTVTIYGDVKLTEKLVNDTVTYVLGSGAQLDLNGNRFTYKSLDTKAANSRIVDTALGNYEFYDSITTTGKQFITTGMSTHNLTGFVTKTSSRRYRGDGAGSRFIGGSWAFNSQNPGSAYASTNYWWPLSLQDNRYSGLTYRFCYEGTNCKDASVAGMELNVPFTYEYMFKTGVQKIKLNGTDVVNTTNDWSYPPSNMVETGVLLFNDSSSPYETLVLTSEWNIDQPLAKNGTSEKATNDSKYGSRGWDGVTEYVKIYNDSQNTAKTNTNLVRDLVPAKSVSSGMIGMFDKVECVFYPLLGKVDYASLNGTPKINTKRANSTLYTVSAYNATELDSVFSGIESGETVYMMSNITKSGDVIVPDGVTLNLNGYRLTATGNVTADSAKDAFIIDKTFSGGVTVGGDFYINKGHEDYQFTEVSSGVYNIKPNWVTRLKKAQAGDIIKLTEDLDDNFDYVLAKGATLDLNNHTMSVKSLDASLGYVIDSTITAEDNTGSAKNLAERSKISANFKYADNNTFKVVDCGNDTYTVRKYTLSFLPGEASGWTMVDQFGELSSDSVYEMYCTYGEVALPEMIYTSAASTGVWSFGGGTADPGSICSVNDDMKFTTKFMALSVTADGQTTYYPSASAGNVSNAINLAKTLSASSSVTLTFLSDAKLNADVDLAGLNVVLGKGAALDLNGHKFTFSTVDTTAPNCRIIDSAAGNYEIYNTITTTGKQFITLGMSTHNLTGLETRTSSRRYRGDGGGSKFIGGGWEFNKTTSGKVYAETNYWWLLSVQDNRYNGLTYRFCYDDGDSSFNCKDGSVPGMELNTMFNYELTFNVGSQKILFNGNPVVNTQNNFTGLPKTMVEVGVLLFNDSSASWESRTMTAASNIDQPLASVGTKEDAVNDDTYGSVGWDGATEYVKIYSDPANTAENTNMVRNLVPAKSVATGMIGMFDLVEHVFYPLFGLTEYASVNECTGIVKLSADGSIVQADRYEVLNSTPVSDRLAVRKSNGTATGECGFFDLTTNQFTADISATGTACGVLTVDGNGHCIFTAPDEAFLSAVLSFARNGDTVAMDAAMNVNASVNVPEGVTLDLCGHDLTVQSLNAHTVIDSSKANAAIFSSGALNFDKDPSQYAYQNVEGGVYLCRLLDPCLAEKDLEEQVAYAIARDVIRLGNNIDCTRTTFGYAIPDGVSIQPLDSSYRIHYYAGIPQILENLLGNANRYCTIHLTDNFMEKTDYYAIPKDVVVLFDGYTFASDHSSATEIDGGLIGKGTENATKLSIVSQLIYAYDTVKLDADIKDSRDYKLGEGVILDLNGHNISCNSFDGSEGHVIDTAKHGGHTITVKDTERTAFRPADPDEKAPNLHHYTVDESVYTFYPYTVTYKPGLATAWTAATQATEGAFIPNVTNYVQEVTRGQVTLAGAIFSNSHYDYSFIGWNTSPALNGELISAGSIRNISQDVILHAQFTKCKFTDKSGKLYCFNDLQTAIKAANDHTDDIKDNRVDIVGNMDVRGDINLGTCPQLVLNGPVVVNIDGDLDINGKQVWCNGGNCALVVSGAIIDSSNGAGFISRVSNALVKQASSDSEYVEVVYPSSTNTYYRYYNADKTRYFDQLTTKIVDGNEEGHSDQKALVFGLSNDFKANLRKFLEDKDTHIYVDMTLTSKESVKFRSEDKSALFFLKKDGDVYTRTCSWEITDLLRNSAAAQGIKVDNSINDIYVRLRNCTDDISVNAQIRVTNGECTIPGSNLIINED